MFERRKKCARKFTVGALAAGWKFWYNNIENFTGKNAGEGLTMNAIASMLQAGRQAGRQDRISLSFFGVSGSMEPPYRGRNGPLHGGFLCAKKGTAEGGRI